MNALAVFHGHGNHWLDPVLKPGFRHVMAAVREENYWVLIDPRAGTPAVTVVANADYDLARFYRDLGYSVVETKRRDTRPKIPWMLNNCVGAVKAVLGLRAPFVLTPHQLWRKLSC